MSSQPRVKTIALTHKEEYCSVAKENPLTGYEPKLPEPSYSCDAELDDEIIRKALSSPLFIQESEEPANLRQAYHSHEESLLPAQFFFSNTQVRGDPYTNLIRAENENQVATQKTSESGFS